MIRRIRDENGSAFLFSMIALVVLLTVGVVSLQIAMQSLDRAKHNEFRAASFNLAEAAADMAEAWLRAQSTPPSIVSPYDPLGGTITQDTGTMRATIYPDPGNPGAWQKTYVIQGVGQSTRDSTSRQVIMKVQEQSFALYAYFTDQERSSVTNGTIWFYSNDRIYGPVHTNDTLHIAWSTSASTPIFADTVSSHASSAQWNPYKPTTTSQWSKVLQGGQSALKFGADNIQLPPSTDKQKNAAWGDTVGFPSATGVYVPTAGSQVKAGIYVYGNSTVKFEVGSPSTVQVIKVTQGTTLTTITVDQAGNTTSVLAPPATEPTVYTGLPNGVIYSTGNITSLEGTLADSTQNGSQVLHRNAWTIATDVNSGKDITLTNNLKYNTQPDPTQPMTDLANLKAAALGVVAEDVVVGSGCPNDMSINGVVLAGSQTTTSGTFYNATWDTTKKSALHLLGGVIQKKRGPVGTFSGTSLVTGYNKDYKYDRRMADDPPPYFPTTGEYDLKSWQEI